MRRYSTGEEVVAGYRLVRFIGRGQFGEVWRGAAPGGVEVALKIIDLHGTVGLRELAGFQCIKRLHHPNLISVNAAWLKTEAGEVLSEWPDPIAEMDYATSTKRFVAEMAQQKDLPSLAELIVAMGLGSKSLHERLQECLREGHPGVPPSELIPLMRQAAAALDYLNKPIHDFGQGPMPLIHGDIKPQNLLIVGDCLQVCDFGLVRALETLRRKATVMGTYAYAAPELLDGAPNRSSDQYCLAITYVECRTSSLPFDASEGVVQVIERHRTGTLDLSQLSPAEEPVVRRATAPRPEDRFASCAQFVEALVRACQAELAAVDELPASVGDVRRTMDAPAGGWSPGGARELPDREQPRARRPSERSAPPSGPPSDRETGLLGATALPSQLDLQRAADEYRPTAFDDHAASVFAQTPVADDTVASRRSGQGPVPQRRSNPLIGAAATAAVIIAVVAGGAIAYKVLRPAPTPPDPKPIAEIAENLQSSEKPPWGTPPATSGDSTTTTVSPSPTPIEKPPVATTTTVPPIEKPAVTSAAKIETPPPPATSTAKVAQPSAPPEKPAVPVEKPAAPPTTITAIEKPAVPPTAMGTTTEKPAVPSTTTTASTTPSTGQGGNSGPATTATTTSTSPKTTAGPAKQPIVVASINPPVLKPPKTDPIVRDYDRAQRAMANGDTDGAIDEFSKVLVADPNHADALRNRGRAYQLRGQPGDLNRAVADLELAVEKRPADIEALECLANAYTDLARSEPGNVDRRLVDKAVEAYTRLHDLDPKRLVAFTGRGVAHLTLGQYDQALQDADLAAAINNHYAPIYNLRGQVYDKQRQFDLAIDAFSKAIEIDPTNYKYWGNRGFCRFESLSPTPQLRNESPQITLRTARTDCQKMIELPPPNPRPSSYSGQLAQAWYIVGNDYFFAHKLIEAIDAFDKAISNNASLALAYYQRSVAYRQTGDQVRSQRDREMAFKLDPHLPELLKSQGSR